MVAATQGLGQMVLNASNFLRTDIVVMGIFRDRRDCTGVGCLKVQIGAMAAAVAWTMNKKTGHKGPLSIRPTMKARWRKTDRHANHDGAGIALGDRAFRASASAA